MSPLAISRTETISRTEKWVVAITFGLAAMGLATVALSAFALKVDAGRLLADPAMYVGFSPFTGALSHAGVIAWCVAATSALFAATTLDIRQGRARFLISVGALSAWLAFDDLFLIHEAAGTLTGTELAEGALFAAYGLTGAGILWRWRDVVLRTPLAVLVLAGGFLGGSIAMDFATASDAFVLEDGAKFVGVLLWAAYVSLSARRLVLARLVSAGPPAGRASP